MNESPNAKKESKTVEIVYLGIAVLLFTACMLFASSQNVLAVPLGVLSLIAHNYAHKQMIERKYEH